MTRELSVSPTRLAVRLVCFLILVPILAVDLCADEWQDKNPDASPDPRSGHSLALVDNQAYLFGGQSNVALNDVWRFGEQQNAWVLAAGRANLSFPISFSSWPMTWVGISWAATAAHSTKPQTWTGLPQRACGSPTPIRLGRVQRRSAGWGEITAASQGIRFVGTNGSPLASHRHGEGVGPSGAIREGDFKLIDFFEVNRFELYNLRKDLSEANDLAESMPEKVDTLRRLLEQWRQKVGAKPFDPAGAG